MKNSIVWISMLIFFLDSCAENASNKADSMALSPQQNLEPSSTLPSLDHMDLYGDGKSQLIKTAHVRFEVQSVKKTTEAIETAIRKYPAYISSSNLHLENPILENKLNIRVQSDYFQLLLKDIDLQAVFVNFRDVTSDDVSKDFVDLETRIRTKREVEERYTEILRRKAGTIKELLEAEQQIGAVHEEIEATIGKLNFLKDQVRYSNINLEFYQRITEPALAQNPDGPFGDFGKAFSSGWSAVVRIALLVTYLWPFLIMITGGYFLYRYKRKIPAVQS